MKARLFVFLGLALSFLSAQGATGPGLIDASDFGFSSTATPAQNVAALQKALDGGKKTVTVTAPGEYHLNARVYIDNETKLLFSPGVVLKKTGHYDFVLVNRGALTRTWNHDITIDGLTIMVNGVDQIPTKEEPVFGLRGHVTMYYARDVKVTRFKCLDLRRNQFCLHFCQFENLVLDGFEIRGDKDGVHIGAGKDFLVRNGVCATYDDAVALNAQDYPTSQPMQGDILDGLVENVTDLHKEKTGGNSVRMLSGAWPDWRAGIVLKNGDTVRHGKNVYRVLVSEVGKTIASDEPPVHTQGLWKDPAGLTFIHNQSDGAVSATVSNVVFRNLRFEEDRNTFKTSWDFTAVNRAIHPDTPTNRIPTIVASMENVTASGTQPFMEGNASFNVQMRQVSCAGPLMVLKSSKNTDCTLSISGATFASQSSDIQGPDILFDGAGALNLTLKNVTQPRDARVRVAKNSKVRIMGDASLASVEGLSPVKGDSIKVRNVRKTWNGTNWVVQSGAPANAFRHPGLLHDPADFDRIRQMIGQGAEPWKGGFQKLQSHSQSQFTYHVRGPWAEVVRDPSTNRGISELEQDCNAAYQNALMWCLTTNKAHAAKSIEILNAWSGTLRSITGHDKELGASLCGFKLVNAAELLRHTDSGWSPQDIAQFEIMLRNVFYTVIKDFATFANGNWDTACIKTMIGMGVFLDDRAMFDHAVDYYRQGSGNGALTHYVVNEAGQCQESGRDQQHAQLGLGHMAEACEIAWHQGVDLYGEADNRLLKGFEYTARYNLGHDVPFVSHTDTTGKYKATAISPDGRGRLRPIYEMVWNHYAQRRGLAAPFTEEAATKIRPEGAAGKSDHPGFGTLLFTVPEVK